MPGEQALSLFDSRKQKATYDYKNTAPGSDSTLVCVHSIHLTCWLDLEQYRTTPQEDEGVRRERSSHITVEYFNRNYFFGPDSPASADQRNDVQPLHNGENKCPICRQTYSYFCNQLSGNSFKWGRIIGPVTWRIWAPAEAQQLHVEKLQRVHFSISLPWYHTDLMLTAVTAGSQWGPGDERTWLELEGENGEECGLNWGKTKKFSPSNNDSRMKSPLTFM